MDRTDIRREGEDKMNPNFLTDEEKNKISSIANDIKFSFDVKSLYSSEEINRLDIFLKCYKFMKYLSDNVKVDVPVRNKLSKTLKDYSKLAIESQKILFEANSSRHYGKHIVNRKAKDFILTNFDKINELNNEAFIIGRRIRMFNPDEEIGDM